MKRRTKSSSRPIQPLPKSTRVGSLARERLEGRFVGGKLSQLASYSDLFERASDGIALIDLQSFEILETNGAFRDLLERDHPADGACFLDFFPDEERDSVSRWLVGGSGVYEVTCSDGRILELEAARVGLADLCEVYQLLVQDVTVQRSRQIQLERQSLTDEMTGLANFRSFSSRLALEHERAQIKRQSYCAVFFDVDHFKYFNDRNGHPAGDEVLRQIARVLRAVSTRSEFVARYGGEEFVVLVAGADLEAGIAYAESARAAIANETFPFGEHQPLGRVSVSVGVAAFNSTLSAQEVLKLADGALYESKHAGRNQVSAAGRERISKNPGRKAGITQD